MDYKIKAKNKNMEKLEFNSAVFAKFNNNIQQKTQKNVEAPKQKKNGKKLIALGAAALATAAVAGIAIYKHKANAATIQQGIQEAPKLIGQTCQEAPQPLQESIQEGIKLFTTNEFKQNFKFENGILMSQNKPFNGLVDVANGKKVHRLELIDGKIQNSVEMQATQDGFKPISVKSYGVNNVRCAPLIQDCSGNYITDIMSATETYIDKDGNTTDITKIFPPQNICTLAKTKVVKGEDGIMSVDKTLYSAYREEPYHKSLKFNITGEGKQAKKVPVENTVKPKKEVHNLYRTTDENGLTYKNDKLFSTRTIKYDDEGNKIITVNYPFHSPNSHRKGVEKIITISPDGQKTYSTNVLLK